MKTPGMFAERPIGSLPPAPLGRAHAPDGGELAGVVAEPRPPGTRLKDCPPYVERWMRVLITQSDYPAPKRLAAQFDAAVITRLCECGCNAFDIEIASAENLLPLALPGGAGMVFEAHFGLRDGGQIELLVFCDKQGNLAGVDVGCDGNSRPVPDSPVLDETPCHVYISGSLLAE